MEVQKVAHNRIRNLEGMRFGELEVIEFAGYLNGRTSWRCKCSCNNMCVVTSHELTSHKTRSCGCLRKRNSALRDISNQIFGERSVIWVCKCMNCGNIIRISEDALVHGNYKSCGCLRYKQSGKLMEHLHFYEGTCLEFLERKRQCDNSSGAVGVYKIKDNRYKASITFKGKKYHLGHFDKFSVAQKVRQEAGNQLFQKFIECYRKWLGGNAGLSINEPFQFDVKRIDGQFYIETNV